MQLNTNAPESAPLDQVVKASKKLPVVIRRKGRAVAVVVGVASEDEADQVIYANCKPLLESLERSARDFKEGKGIPHEEMWKMLDAEFAEEDAKQAKKKSTTPRRKKSSVRNNAVSEAGD